MRDTHASTNGDVESGKFAIRVGDSDETDIVGEDIDVVERWNGNSDFELRSGQYANLAWHIRLKHEPCEVSRTPRKGAQRP